MVLENLQIKLQIIILKKIIQIYGLIKDFLGKNITPISIPEEGFIFMDL